MHSILVQGSICKNDCINAAWQGGNQPVALLRSCGSTGWPSARLYCTVLIFLLTIPHRFSMWAVGRCQVLLEKEISISTKLVSRQKHEVLWLKSLGRRLHWLWTWSNTVDQHQQMTWHPKSSLTVETSSNWDSVPLHSSSRFFLLRSGKTPLA